jgi:hypothetical protein
MVARAGPIAVSTPMSNAKPRFQVTADFAPRAISNAPASGMWFYADAEILTRRRLFIAKTKRLTALVGAFSPLKWALSRTHCP